MTLLKLYQIMPDLEVMKNKLKEKNMTLNEALCYMKIKSKKTVYNWFSFKVYPNKNKFDDFVKKFKEKIK